MTRFRDTFDFMDDGKRERSRFGDSENDCGNDRVEKSDLIDLDLVLHHQTELAVKVSSTGRDAQAVWIPKSRIEFVSLNRSVDGETRSGQRTLLPLVQVTLPERLAKEKGLV